MQYKNYFRLQNLWLFSMKKFTKQGSSTSSSFFSSFLSLSKQVIWENFFAVYIRQSTKNEILCGLPRSVLSASTKLYELYTNAALQIISFQNIFLFLLFLCVSQLCLHIIYRTVYTQCAWHAFKVQKRLETRNFYAAVYVI